VDEIGATVEVATIEQVVASAHRDLVGEVPEGALAEFTHRLARARLDPDNQEPVTLPDPGRRATTNA
jgi:hypothetical protein